MEHDSIVMWRELCEMLERNRLAVMVQHLLEDISELFAHLNPLGAEDEY
jgi:hypothetical protein